MILKTTCLKAQQFNQLPSQTYLIFSILAIYVLYGTYIDNKGLTIEIEDQNNPPSFSGFNSISTENKSSRYSPWNPLTCVAAAAPIVGAFRYDGKTPTAAPLIFVKTGWQRSKISYWMMNNYFQNKDKIKKIVQKYAGRSICTEIRVGFSGNTPGKA